LRHPLRGDEFVVLLPETDFDSAFKRRSAFGNKFRTVEILSQKKLFKKTPMSFPQKR